MIFSVNDKIFAFNSKVLQTRDEFVFLSRGSTFPESHTVVTLYKQMRFEFTKKTDVVIDYGDGSVITYPALSANNRVDLYAPANGESQPSNSYAPYVYADGDNTKIRTIRIRIREKNALRAIILRQLSYPQPLLFPFTETKLLDTLSLTNMALTDINDSYLTLPGIDSVTINQGFASNTRYAGVIPIDLVKVPLSQLSYQDSRMGNYSFAQNNLDKLALYQSNSLTILSLAGCNINQAAGLPSNFSDLSALKTLRIGANMFTSIPAAVNQITTLTELNLDNSSSLTGYGNISNLVNLVRLGMNNCPNLVGTIPAYFSNFTKLRNLTYRSLGRTNVSQQTDFITSLYNLMVANAAITGANTLPFRGMTVDINSESSRTAPIPGGVYQQPAGYVQGVSNGTPVSSLERIWVMANQYGHNWIYRTV